MIPSRLQQEALKLPEDDRALLAEILLSSLGDEAASLNEARWLEKAERRYEEYRAGRMTARLSDDVFQDAYRKLE